MLELEKTSACLQEKS